MFVKSKPTRTEIAGAIRGMLENDIKVNRLDVISKLIEPLRTKASLLKITGDDIVMDVKNKEVTFRENVKHIKPLLIFVKDSACNCKSTIMMEELAINLNKGHYETSKKPQNMSSILFSFFSNSDNFDFSFVIGLRGSKNPFNVFGSAEENIARLRNETIRLHDTHNLIYIDANDECGELEFELFDISNTPVELLTMNSLSEYLSRHGKVKLNTNELMEVV